VVLVAPHHEDLTCVRQVLDLFAGASGLVTNVDKCVATPIAEVQQAFPCVVPPFRASIWESRCRLLA
jgi:hypothetical protein